MAGTSYGANEPPKKGKKKKTAAAHEEHQDEDNVMPDNEGFSGALTPE